jgi:RimJ/RimL family protein N-acetyltransferase
MKTEIRPLENELVTLEPADTTNVELLVRWTLDPIAQGPHKRVPDMTADELRTLFLTTPDRQYCLIRRSADGHPLGRFYWRKWRFMESLAEIDWELNIFLADPLDRGKGYGAAVQLLASDYLLAFPETRSVFAFTFLANVAEQRALIKAGFRNEGLLPHAHYRVHRAELSEQPCLLFVKPRVLKSTAPTKRWSGRSADKDSTVTGVEIGGAGSSWGRNRRDP